MKLSCTCLYTEGAAWWLSEFSLARHHRHALHLIIAQRQIRMRLLITLGLVAVYAAGALAACDEPTIDYFPEAQELEPGFAVNITTGYQRNVTICEVCNGTQNCNYPSVWSSASQTAAATKAGVNPNGGLLMVVLPTDRESTLYFKVSSPLLVKSNTTFIDGCLLPVAGRKLLSTGSPRVNVSVKTAGKIEYTVKLDDGAPTAGDVIGTAGGKLVVPKESAAGVHCAELAVTIKDYDLEDSTGASAFNLTDASKGVTSKKICWYKPAADKATATVVLDTTAMCANPTGEDMKIDVNISGVTPSYVALMQHTTDLAEPLLRPVVHIYGRRVSALDGTPDTAEYDATSPKNFVSKYFLFPSNFTAASSLAEELAATEMEEGYYNISAKVFVMSDFKDLIGFPTTPIAQTEVDAVKGQAEIMTQDLFRNSKIPLQKSLTTLSEIGSNKEGKVIKANDDIEFTWTFAGAPKAQTCKHGDETAKPCSSPYPVKAKDVTDGKKVDFIVEFTDVCDKKKDARYQYTATGVTALTKVDTTTTAGAGTVKAPGKNTAGAVAPLGFLATAVMSLLMAAFL